MYLLDHTIQCRGRSDRIEIFPFGDCHIGKYNCAEDAIKKQIREILKRDKMPNRHIRVLFGGDQLNAISPVDTRRFDFSELADWFVTGKAVTIKERLSNTVSQEVKHAVELFEPVQHLTLGAIYGNHEKAMRTRQNVDAHSAFCEHLGIQNLSDEAFIRFKFVRNSGVTVVKLYIRHGYGSGRTAGAEPNKLQRMIDEWENADICLTGHTHTFTIAPPKPVLWIPNRGKMPEQPLTRYRYGANWGCWLLSHLPGPGSYESSACYPARPMMTIKVVIWPFWRSRKFGSDVCEPKIEIRQYPLL